MMTKRTASTILIGIMVLILGGFYFYEFTANEPSLPPTSMTVSTSSPMVGTDEATIRKKVEEFGAKLQMVSLLAPDRARSMEQHYAPYVAPDLLRAWGIEGAEALGRYSSNPRPDSMNVIEAKREGDRYIVEANVIEVTEAEKEVVAVYPVTLTFEKRSGSWMIVHMVKGAYSEILHTQTLIGYWECLPVKDLAIEQTLECAIGIATAESDGHFAVNTMLMSQYPVDLPMGTKVRVSGIVVPADQLSSVQKYDIDGVINATVIEKI